MCRRLLRTGGRTAKVLATGPDDLTGSEVSDFFRDQYAVVVKFLVHVGAEFHEAEDVTQEAMIRLFRNWPRVENRHGWIRRVAVRIFVSGRREATREAMHVLAAAADASHDGDARLDEPGEIESVRSLLALLPPAQQKTMALVVDGLTVDEVAALLHARASTVRSNLRHARNRLKQSLSDDLSIAAGMASQRGSDPYAAS
jgi:RNA polymerase sigma factor (sigma-70 family)